MYLRGDREVDAKTAFKFFIQVLQNYLSGSARDRFRQFFLGGSTQLTEANLVCSSEDRYQLATESMGTVLVELAIVLRNFKSQGVEI